MTRFDGNATHKVERKHLQGPSFPEATRPISQVPSTDYGCMSLFFSRGMKFVLFRNKARRETFCYCGYSWFISNITNHLTARDFHRENVNWNCFYKRAQKPQKYFRNREFSPELLFLSMKIEINFAWQLHLFPRHLSLTLPAPPFHAATKQNWKQRSKTSKDFLAHYNKKLSRWKDAHCGCEHLSLYLCIQPFFLFRTAMGS